MLKLAGMRIVTFRNDRMHNGHLPATFRYF